MKKSFIKELLHRRIPQIIGSYFIASTSMILFLDWLKVNYAFPKEYITLALFGALSILPSVIILAYFHGAPGKDEWTKIEKLDSGHWLIQESFEEVSNSIIEHIN